MDGGGAAFDFRYGRRASPGRLPAIAIASANAVAAASIVVTSFLAECSKSSSAFANLDHATFSEENTEGKIKVYLFC